jgi:archaellum component FlaC
MFWFWKKNVTLQKELDEAKVKIERLEQKMEVTAMTMHNLQSALIAMSKTQDGVAHDVRHIQEIVQSVFQEFEGVSMWGTNSERDDFN